MSILMKRVMVLGALCLAVFAAASPSLAILVRPILIELTASGTGSTGSIEVVNDRNRPMAVEVKVNRLDMPVEGQPVLTADDGKDFLIFPAIAQLPPGGRQVFRVRYVGDPAIAQSKLFMFSSSELPVSDDASEQRAQLQVLYSIHSIVAVKPPRAQPDIEVLSVSRATGPKQEAGLRILFENKGPAHGYVGNQQLNLRSGGWRKSFDVSESSRAFGLGLVPANSKRSLFVALPDVPASGDVTAELKPAPAA